MFWVLNSVVNIPSLQRHFSFSYGFATLLSRQCQPMATFESNCEAVMDSFPQVSHVSLFDLIQHLNMCF
eukprot:m.224101 g.224101  ORF g.224101 m.224101 type:complete len:69 (-) comp17030_c1_seq1:375-581(-)